MQPLVPIFLSKADLDVALGEAQKQQVTTQSKQLEGTAAEATDAAAKVVVRVLQEMNHSVLLDMNHSVLQEMNHSGYPEQDARLVQMPASFGVDCSAANCA